MTPTKTVAIPRRLADEWRKEEERLCEQFGEEIIPRSMRARRIKDTKVLDAAVEMIERLEEAESDALEQARLNGMGASREAALMAKLEEAEKERDRLKELDSRRCAALNRQVIYNARLAEENDALRAKIAEMERQEPFDADSDVFRASFEAALKAGNWPATRQGDGYRSPSTQIAWRIAFSTVNRLKLYPAPRTKGE